MKKYRIVQEIDKEVEYFWVQERLFFLFWDNVVCRATLDKAKETIEELKQPKKEKIKKIICYM